MFTSVSSLDLNMAATTDNGPAVKATKCEVSSAQL